MGMNNGFAEIGRVLDGARVIGLASHVRPDADALGSIVALGASLRLAGKEVRVLSEDGVPANLMFLPGMDTVERPSGKRLDLDVAVALDTAMKERLGEGVNAAFAGAGLLVNIDHHGTNPRYGHLNHIDPAAPATGQILYDFLKHQGLPMDETVRQNLYAAISTDTGSFQFSSTNSRTHRIIAEMMDEGSGFALTCQRLYHTFPLRRLQLQKVLLNELKFSAGGRIASWVLTRRVQEDVGVQGGDTEGLIDLLRGVDTVVCPVIFEELPDGRVRASVRSKDERLDVSRICQEFGGGGHRMAAGVRLAGPVEAAEKRLLEALEDEIKRLG